MRRVRRSPRGALKLGTYPYTYARVMALKGKLIKPAEYQRLMKVSLAGLLKFLNENQEYRKDLEKLGMKYKGLRLLEIVLHWNLMETYSKMCRISPVELDILFEVHLLRKDMLDIKTILRGVNAGVEREKIWEMIFPVHFTREEYEKLLLSTNVEEVLRQLDFIPFEEFTKALSHHARTGNLSLIEIVLDKFLHKGMLTTVKSLPQQAQVLKDYLLLEIDLLNLMAILKLKAANLPTDKIRKVVIFSGGHLDRDELEQMVGAELPLVIQLIKSSQYGELFQHLDEEKPNLTAIEIELERFKLKRSTRFLHRQPLSADVIIGYLFAKEVEVKNLMLLGKAAHLGLKEEFVQNNLVT